MFAKSFLLSLVLTGALASPLAANTAAKPVFGYLSSHTGATLTLNGQARFELQVHSNQWQNAFEEDVAILARQLNQIALHETFQSERIQPIYQQGHYEIRYGQQRLLRLGAHWDHYRKQSRLSTLLEVSNQLRTQLGAPALRSFEGLRLPAHQVGKASWYGGFFHGRRTANGERYNVNQLTAAHKKLPFGSRVLVTNLNTHKSVMVKINDRGPFVGNRVIDLSPAAFKRIGSLGEGVLNVKLTVLR